jgi:ATP-dependent helicase/nuclease subunit A
MQSPTHEHLKRHEIVRAGAGAGKTYTLTHKVMDIAEQSLALQKRLPRIVVTTFTRKATQELRERLMLLALEEKPHLIDFVNSRSHLVVSTIHGVMDLFLKRYGGIINMDPGYTVIGSGEASKLARQTLRQVILRDDATTSLLEKFPFNRLVSLVRRLDSLLMENPEASPFTLDDFEKIFETHALKVARDLQVVAQKIKEESVSADWLQMADSYLDVAAILKRGDWTTNRSNALAVLEAMKSARRNAKSPPVTDTTANEAQDVRECAKELRASLFDPEAWKVFCEGFQEIDSIGREFSTQFRQAKMRQGLLEISDLELLAMECIRKHPETAESFCREWDYWLIDEYQDTSPFQVELLKRLSGESPNFIVGDPQQSIYLFRGARSEVFGRKESEILEGGGERKLLVVNRRSRPELLLFLNDFFTRLNPPFQPMEAFFKEGESIDSSRLVAKIFRAGTTFRAGATADDQNDKDRDPEQDEMQAIVSHVQSLLEAGEKPEEICVLARTNGTLAEIAIQLGDARIPTHVHAASGFFDRLEIRDALALLKFLVNPHDNFNMIQLLRSPWFKMPDAAMGEITIKRPESVWESLLTQRSMSDEFRAIARLERLLQEAAELGLSSVFKTALIQSGLIDCSHLHDVSGRRESNIWKLITRLEVEERKPGFNPISFISGSVSDLKVEEGNAEGDAVAAVEPARVNLMTVHASKGLEFKHVILPRMQQKPRITTNEEFTYDENSGRWALRMPWGENSDMTGSLAESMWLERFQEQELREHVRVLYVALTRAVETVFMSWTAPAEKNSWAEMVGLDLSPGRHQSKSYSYEVMQEPPPIRPPLYSQADIVQPRALWREPASMNNALGLVEGHVEPQALSVTEIMDRKPGAHFLTTNAQEVSVRLKIAAQGTMVHRLMELLKYPSRERMEKLIQKWFPNQEEKVLEAVGFVRRSENPPLLQIIANGFVEWGFAIVHEGILIEGQVDLWGRTDDGEAWIIDYKTGNSARRKKAFEQMSLYALALRKSGFVKQDEIVRLAAVYPFTQEVFIADAPEVDRWFASQLKSAVID